MDRIAELEGQLAQPEPMPEPSPYIPGQTPFPGIPDFIRNLDFSNIDFSNIPGLSNFDYDDIMRQYNDRMEMGEPEPVESFLPDPRDLPPMGPMPVMDEPKFTTMPIGPRGPGMSIEDMLEGRVTTMPVEEPVYTTMPVGEPVRLTPEAVRDIIERREEPITRREEPRLMPMPVRMPEPAPVMPRISMPKLPNFQSPVVPTPAPRPAPRPIPQPIAAPTLEPRPVQKPVPAPALAPAPRQEPIYIPPVMVPNIPKIPNIPNIDFSNLPKFDLPTTGGRPMIPKFGNINLR